MSFLEYNINRLNELKKELMFIIICSFTIYGTYAAEAEYLSKVKPLLEKLDLTVDPCEDFYEYVCGYLKTREIPNTSSRIDQHQTMFDKTTAQMIKLASADINPEEPKTYQLIKTYYQSCIDSTSIENRGLQPLHDILNALGGWPVILGNSWNGKNFSWPRTDITLTSLGYKPKYLFHFDVTKDEYDASKNILAVEESENYIKDLRHYDYLLKAYKKYMVNVAVLLGANEDYAIKELNETFQFEWNLWKASHNTIKGISEHLVNRLSIAELQKRYPYVKWFKYLNYMTYPHTFSEADFIYLTNPTYLYAIGNLLTNTPKRVIANYMIWRAIDDSVEFLNKEMRDAKIFFTKTCTGIKESSPSEERCIKIMMNMDNAMLPGISAMYLKNYFHNDTRGKVAGIFSMIKETYENIVSKSWLDDGTKVRALRKLALMKNMIGCPDELLNLDFIDNYYKNVHLEHSKFFENSMKLRSFLYENVINKVKKPPGDTFWHDAAVAALADAHYNAHHNAIVISASLIQYPIYDENQPDCMNYGKLGHVIGHEMTHALTFEHIPWDEYGSKMRWWTVDDRIQYGKRIRCFITQFKNYTNNEFRAQFTLAENIAGIEAAKIGYKAYTAWKKKKGQEELLHFFNHTDEQLYWINIASYMCSKHSIELTNMSLFTNTHATPKLRVSMDMANSADFAKSFACPVGSPMNPVEKCSFW